jgi:hypothetical protein
MKHTRRLAMENKKQIETLTEHFDNILTIQQIEEEGLEEADDSMGPSEGEISKIHSKIPYTESED